MTDNKKSHCKSEPPAKSENCPALQRSDTEIEAENNYMAKAAMSPEFSAASVVQAYNREGKT